MFVDAIWVIDTPSLWDQIRKDVEELVAKAIFEEKLKILRTRLDSYASSLRRIQTYQGNTQYNQLMQLRDTIALDSAYFMNKDDDRHKITALLPLFTPMAVMHFSVTYLTATSGETCEPIGTNRKANWDYSDDLKKLYYPYGRMSVKVANQWRQNQIEVTDNVKVTPTPPLNLMGYSGSLKCVDHVTGKTVLNKSYSKLGSDPTQDDRAFIKNYKEDVRVKTEKHWQENALDIIEPWRFPEYVEEKSFQEQIDASVSKAIDDAKKAFDSFINKINPK